MKIKTCSRCKETLPITNFYVKYKSPKIVYYPECKSCRTIIVKNYTDKNKQRVLDSKRKHNKKLRDTFLEMYGSVCVCCGETIKEFLTLEHKLGQKGIVRSKKHSGKTAYAIAVREYRPDLYEVLCWNCNCSKGRYGYCPHQKITPP